MCLGGSPKTPPVQHTPPPPMMLPAAENQDVQRKRKVERQRLASMFGRQSTILGSASGMAGPTSQQKTLLGT